MDLVARAKGLILDPQAEWRAIALEPTGPAFLLARYVAVLAVIPALCGLIGSLILGSPILPSILPSILFAAVSYVLTVVAVCAEAVLIDALAPMFGGQRNFSNAFKLAAYFPTAYWFAAIFFAIPMLSVLVLLGLYSFYLLRVGLPVLMRVPPEQAVACTASAGIGALIFAAIGLTIAARVSGVALWVF